jgi:hypothetical protein
MGLPRSKYVRDGEVGVYHCYSRCVRRAFLCGFDKLTGRDFSHRKAWLVNRLRYLAATFAIDVCAYSVMETHYHTILRTRPDIVATWSDREVAVRWLTLFPKKHPKAGPSLPPNEQHIRALEDCPAEIAKLRRRLSSLSWFMGQLNEFISRAANKEDKVKGRFWESRFKCQALLDEAATASGMVYVDLNLIRAGLAATPEESDFTSIQERIRAWQKENRTTASVIVDAVQSLPDSTLTPAEGKEVTRLIPGQTASSEAFPENGPHAAAWLCPIASDPHRRGILDMTEADYFNLVDLSGRMVRSDKAGAIDSDLVPILLRIGARPDAWAETISTFGSKFRLAAGLVSNLRTFADQLGRRWLKGLAAARAAFVPSSPQPA